MDNLYDIAIIGMAGKFPGARNLDEFWRNLANGVESISFFTDEELLEAGLTPEILADPNFVKAASVIDDADMFDAGFFGFYPKEAETMDPQQRVLLETAWQALETAGYNCESFKGRIGVFAGVSVSSYFINNLAGNPELMESMDPMQSMVANDRDFLSTRISYKLNLKGPSITVQTACSTSLVAVHMACQSLLSRESDMAMAGGVSIGSPRKRGYYYQEGGILSPDGHCRAFDARSQGTIAGEGAGVIVLKRLTDALEDGDCIHAVIKGSAVNNDGALKVGYTAPSIEGQSEVIAEALSVAGVSPADVSYVEAHGTGTPVGDPIEIAALNQAFRAASGSRCAIGAVKSNIGHLDAAAGIAGLMKTVLALKHRMIPASLNYEGANPQIDFANGPFYVNAATAEWNTNGKPRVAGVSSFGIGGTNAHVVVAEAPLTTGRPDLEKSASRPSQLILLSAKTKNALNLASQNLRDSLIENPQSDLADIAHTLQVGRVSFNHKRALICRDSKEAAELLESLSADRVLSRVEELKGRPAAFMFPGQGAQHPNMGAELYNIEREFRDRVVECARLLEPFLGYDIRRELYPDDSRIEEARARLTRTELAQPALFVVEYALARLLMSWGVVPAAMIGHSIGEYVAACLSGVLSLEDALRLVAARGRLMQKLPSGGMLAVSVPEAGLAELLGPKLSLAAVNGPGMCVASGIDEEITRLEQELKRREIGCRRLHTSHAFHSEMMDPILSEFEDEVKRCSFKPPQIPYLSNVTGTWITAAEASDPSYWSTHLRRTVRFSEGIVELLEEPERVLLEAGPGWALNKLVKGHRDAAQRVVSTMREQADSGQSDYAALLGGVAELWLAGVEVDWQAFQSDQNAKRIPLPTYPFERQRYWIEPNPDAMAQYLTKRHGKPEMSEWFYVPAWKQTIAPRLAGAPSVGENGCWLLFVDEMGLGASLAQRLAGSGQNVVTVKQGPTFKKVSDREYEIAIGERVGYGSVLAALRSAKLLPMRIGYLWGVTRGPDREPESDAARYLNSLLFLAQALGDEEYGETIHIEIVSNGVHDITGGEELSPAKATLLAPNIVIPQEYVNLVCRATDIVLDDIEQVCDQLLAEFKTESEQRLVAYRRNHRWVQAFDAVRLEPDADAASRLRPNGVYLITGAFKEVGMAAARYLAGRIKPRLALIGDTAVPPRDQWPAGSGSNGSSEGVAAIVEQLRALEELGAEVLPLQASAGDRAALELAIAQVRNQFGSINGVIHTEWVQGEGLIQLKTPEMLEPVLAPKVSGTLLLDSLLSDDDLDFFVIYSSTTSIVGGFGLVDYCAANLFADAFAVETSSRRGRFTASINWSLWQWDDWQEKLLVGMPDMQSQLKAVREEYGVTIEEGIEVLDRILCGNAPQIVVSTQEFNGVIEQFKGMTAASFLAAVDGSHNADSAYSRPDLGTEYAPPTNDVERRIVGLMQDLFGIDGIGIHDNFFDLGGNSLVAITLISRLRKEFNADVAINVLFESPTAALMAQVIAQTTLKEEELDELDRILKEIEALSADEIKTQLAQEKTASAGEEQR